MRILKMFYCEKMFSTNSTFPINIFSFVLCFLGLYGAIMRTGKMKDLTQFDAEFFGYPPALAERSDPQQRMLLEVVYETIIDAGL